MKREVYAKLLEWKSRKDHKPLVLIGKATKRGSSQMCLKRLSAASGNSLTITGHLMPSIWPTGGNGVKNGVWK